MIFSSIKFKQKTKIETDFFFMITEKRSAIKIFRFVFSTEIYLRHIKEHREEEFLIDVLLGIEIDWKWSHFLTTLEH